MGIKLSLFGGVSPAVAPRLLPAQGAQTALNCKLWHGDLRPWRTPLSVATPTKAGTKLSIYRFGQDVTDEALYWFHWLTDVDTVRGPVAADASERTYYTGDGVPKVTDSSIALLGGTDYPMNSYTLGLPAPAATPSVAVSGSGSGQAVSKAYVYTYVTAWGEEGPPSAASAIVNVQLGQTVNITGLSVAPAGAYNVVSKRIYRTVSGTSSTDYRFVDEIPVANTTYNDSIDDTTVALNDSLESLEWIAPPTTMTGLVALPNGILAGINENDVCFSEPFVPSAWPNKYRQSTGWKLVGLGVIGQSIVACTKGKPYLLTGTDPSAMSMDKIEIGKACVSKRSIANVGGQGVAYAAPGGLAMVGPSVPGGSRIITDTLMTYDDWQALVPTSISGYEYNGRYFGFYDTGSVQGGFILDPSQNAPTFTFTDQHATAGYNDPIRDALYLQLGNDIKRWDGGGSNLSYTWRSKIVTPLRPMNIAVGKVEAGSYPVTMKLYADGNLVATRSVANARQFTLPGGYKAREFEVQIEGSVQVKAVHLAESGQDLNK